MHITVNNCKLFFEVYGSNLLLRPRDVREKPTLIVLHGGPGIVDHTIYVNFWSKFANVAEVIFLDQRGCGRSDRCSADTWNLAQWADDLAQFCFVLGIDKPIIAGISMGGHVMCEYISRYPEQPAGLIFCNTEARFLVDNVTEKFRSLGGEAAASAAQQHLTQSTPDSGKTYLKYCVPHYAKNAYKPEEIGRCIQNMDIFYHYFRHHLNQFNYLNKLQLIQCPTLLMVGEASPLHLPKRAVEMAQAINPALVTHHIFKQAGAPVYKDAPEEAEIVVNDFLKKLSSVA